MVTGPRDAAAPTSVLDLAGEEYVLLTTYTKDGRAKPRPVWAAPDDDALVVITGTGTWKVRRVTNTPRVTLQACDSRGRPRGASVEGLAVVVTDRLAERVDAAIGTKYGWKHGLISFGRRFSSRVDAAAGLVIRDVSGP